MYEKEANTIKYILQKNKYDSSIINQFSKIKSKEEIHNAKKKGGKNTSVPSLCLSTIW
jgi:hypothetical protein